MYVHPKGLPLGDEMKEMGLPPFNFEGELMGMELAAAANVKQEHGALPPNVGPLPPSTHNVPSFNLTASPPQQSPVFMERIHSDAQRPAYPPNDFAVRSLSRSVSL